MSPELRQSAVALHAALAAGKLRVADVADHYLQMIASHDRELGCFLHVDPEQVLADARRLDQKKSAAKPGALFGLPIAIKDNICTRDAPTTCASRILDGYRPPYDATCVGRIREADGLILGKTNLDEFAMGASTENSAFQKTRNPHALGCVPGGSSGGSAAAVASGLAALALGSDTGGSVRQPASFCGVAGLRPTYGTVSRSGLVAFASSLDQIGPIGRNIADMRLLFDVIAQPDPGDSTSLEAPAERAAAGAAKAVKIGLPKEYFGSGVDSEVGAAARRAAERLQERGAALHELSLPLTDHAIAVYYLVVAAEASSNLSRFDGVRYGLRADAERLRDMYERTREQGFGPEVKRRILLGTFALSSGYYDAYYKKAQQARQQIRKEFHRAFAEVDVLLGPTAPTAAFELGAKTQDPLELYLCDVFTAPSALAGLPAVSLNAGMTGDGRPIGVQLIAPRGKDFRLLDFAAALEQDLGQPLAPTHSVESPA